MIVQIKSFHNVDCDITAVCPYCDNAMMTFEELIIVRNAEIGPDEVACLAHADCHQNSFEIDDEDEDEDEE